MPTYTCTIAQAQLSQTQKAAIARRITQIHSEVTGAPGSFAQVIFREVKPGNHFMGGAPLGHDTLFVHGHIRAGRTAEQKRALLTKMAAALGEAAGLAATGIWIYVAELPSAQMMEFGQVLPVPGGEAAWTEALPREVRAFMRSVAGR